MKRSSSLKNSKYSRGASLEEDYTSGPLGNKKTYPKIPEKWKYMIIGCGSNAFGQLNNDELDIFCPKMEKIVLPQNEKKEYINPDAIACGHHLTMACSNGQLYYWGSGMSTNPIKVPTFLSSARSVVQVSCGQNHAGFITKEGSVYTWGHGESGALGHGNKQNQNSPKMIDYLRNKTILQISCGSYHTAIVAEYADQVLYVRSPACNLDHDLNNSIESSNLKLLESDYRNISCGTAYICGTGKAGQLGLGDSVQFCNRFTEVVPLSELGLKVGKVSCGMHHTLFLAIPIYSIKGFNTSIYSCGWGEYGRLGHGDEHGKFLPTLVKFEEPFHPIDISAGEQHSLATSLTPGACYGWGSNSFGQCGVSSPTVTDMCLSPMKIPLPDNMIITRVSAGGRHSGAISACGKILLWGWGEEGQLGSGNEKNSWLPRPVKLPTIQGSRCIPMKLSLGFCHTIVLLRNVDNAPQDEVVEAKQEVEQDPLPQPPPKVETEVEDVQSPQVVAPVEPSPPPKSPQKIPLIESPKKSPQEIVITKDPTPIQAPTQRMPIRSLKDILSFRESRRECNESIVDVMDTYQPITPVQSMKNIDVVKTKVEILQEDESKLDKIAEEIQKLSLHRDDTLEHNASQELKRRGSGGSNQSNVQYFYKEGQDLESCYIANAAKRAEMRKQKKQTSGESFPTSSSNKNNARAKSKT